MRINKKMPKFSVNINIYICSLASYFLVHLFELQFSTKLSFYKDLNDGGIFFVRKLPMIKMKKEQTSKFIFVMGVFYLISSNISKIHG